MAVKTLDDARAVRWPFVSPHRPIGELLDAGRIGVSDLQFGLRRAYSGKLKAACRLLLGTLIISPPRPVVSTIPAVCPICGADTRPDHRWDSERHGPGWRCSQSGLTHCLTLTRLPIVKAVFAPEFVVVPAVDSQPPLTRRDMARGPIGYLPAADR